VAVVGGGGGNRAVGGGGGGSAVVGRGGQAANLHPVLTVSPDSAPLYLSWQLSPPGVAGRVTVNVFVFVPAEPSGEHTPPPGK